MHVYVSGCVSACVCLCACMYVSVLSVCLSIKRPLLHQNYESAFIIGCMLFLGILICPDLVCVFRSGNVFLYACVC